MKGKRVGDDRPIVYPIVGDVTRICTGEAQAPWTFFDEIVWVKGAANAGALHGRPLFGSYPYPPTPKILDSIFENILVFEKAGRRRSRSRETREASRLTLESWRQWTCGVWHVRPDRREIPFSTLTQGAARR